MELLRGDNPFFIFRKWFLEAEAKEGTDFNAMSLATVSAAGQPSVRMVLLKEVDDRGFVFYTNTQSRKAAELAANPKAGLCLHWKSLQRQVRVTGPVETLPAIQVQAYFQTRHPQSRLGAWASAQSRPLDNRAVLEEKVADYARQYGTQDIPCPPHWGGYRVVAHEIEFWAEGAHRLHDRFVFTRPDENTSWDMARLNP